MIEALRHIQQQSGAIFSENQDIPESFANDAQAYHNAQTGLGLCDRSHWGLLKITGEDRLRYLHNQSTNDFQQLQAGQGCDTVFVTSTARTLDLATAYATEDAVFLLVSPHRRQKLIEWLDRFIFPFDKVEISDVSGDFAIFTLIGAESPVFLQKLGIEGIFDQPLHHHQLCSLDHTSVRVAVGSGLTLTGFTFLIPIDNAPQIWSKFTTMGAIPLGDRVWEQLRIQQGRPKPDQELTEDYNPLEVGLWQTISFTKGCYIGQETIARLNTYKGVKQRLWGVRLNSPVEVGTKITLDGEKVGILSSYTNTPEGHLGLAYIRTKAGGIGLKVQLGDVEGEIISVPFLSHEADS